MAAYCEICGEELDPEEEGICENCKLSRRGDSNYEKDEDYVDPGVTQNFLFLFLFKSNYSAQKIGVFRYSMCKAPFSGFAPKLCFDLKIEILTLKSDISYL